MWSMSSCATLQDMIGGRQRFSYICISGRRRGEPSAAARTPVIAGSPSRPACHVVRCRMLWRCLLGGVWSGSFASTRLRRRSLSSRVPGVHRRASDGMEHALLPVKAGQIVFALGTKSLSPRKRLCDNYLPHYLRTLRRNIPVIPASPPPSSIRLDGSGTLVLGTCGWPEIFGC